MFDLQRRLSSELHINLSCAIIPGRRVAALAKGDASFAEALLLLDLAAPPSLPRRWFGPAPVSFKLRLAFSAGCAAPCFDPNHRHSSAE